MQVQVRSSQTPKSYSVRIKLFKLQILILFHSIEWTKINMNVALCIEWGMSNEWPKAHNNYVFHFFFLRIFQLILRIDVLRTFRALIAFIIIWSSIRNHSFIFMNKLSLSKRMNSQALIIIKVRMEFECIFILNILWYSFFIPLAHPNDWSLRNWMEFHIRNEKIQNWSQPVKQSHWTERTEWSSASKQSKLNNGDTMKAHIFY